MLPLLRVATGFAVFLGSIGPSEGYWWRHRAHHVTVVEVPAARPPAPRGFEAGGIERVPAPAPVTAPPASPAPFAVSQGHAEEILRRIRYWEERGTTAGPTTTLSTGKVRIGNQTYRVEVRLIPEGDGPDQKPEDSLLRDLWAAFAADPEPAGGKEAARKGLVAAYRRAAGQVDDPQLKTAEDVATQILRPALNDNVRPKALPQTEQEVDRFLGQVFPSDPKTPLDATLRAKIRDGFTRLANALDQIRDGKEAPKTGDLVKDLQTAFAADPEPPKGGKEAARKNLAMAYRTAANRVNEGGLATAGDLFTQVVSPAVLSNVDPRALPQTRQVIDRFLESQGFPADRKAREQTRLDAGLRAKIGGGFAKVADALEQVR